MQRDPFGEKLITITAHNLNSTQISHFVKRMHEYEDPDYGKQAPTREVSAEEDDDDFENALIITTKKPWDNDEDAIDAGEYEKEKKKKRMKRKAKVVEEEDEEEAISAYNVSLWLQN